MEGVCQGTTQWFLLASFLDEPGGEVGVGAESSQEGIPGKCP